MRRWRRANKNWGGLMNSHNMGRGALVITAALLAALTLTAVSILGFTETRQTLITTRTAGAAAVALTVRTDLDRAGSYGMALDSIPGMTEYLSQRAARAEGVLFLAVVGGDGRLLHGVGPEPDRPPPLAATAPTGDAAGGVVEVRLPLRHGAGAVVAGVRPPGATEGLWRELIGFAPFWLGCLLSAGIWAACVARSAVTEPFDRLADAMAEAATGRFRHLLVRRSRDGVGQCLFAFNAVAAGLHQRRATFVAQSEEVENAVFDSGVAAQAAATRAAVLARLGDGLATPPVKLFDRRGGDIDLFTVAAVIAGVIGVADVVEAARSPAAMTLGAAAAGVVAGVVAGAYRTSWTAGVVIALAAAACGAATATGSAVWLQSPAGFAAISGFLIGWSAGLSFRRHRQYDRRKGGWVWPAAGGFIAGLAIAGSLSGDPPTTGIGTAFFAAAAALVAAGQWRAAEKGA